MAGSTDKRRTCVFCGRAPTTNEHIFPFWLREAVGGAGAVTHFRFDGRGGGPEPGDPLQFDHTRDAPKADVKVKAICAPCNNGWMNQLDQDVEPVIVPLIRNRATEVSEESRQLLSRWATKIGLLLEHTRSRSDLTRRRSLTSPRAYREFFRTQLPQPETRIWMFLIHPPVVGSVWRTAPVPVAAYDGAAARELGAPNGTLTTFAMGMLGFQLMHVPLTPTYHDLAAQRTERGEPFMRQLWPATKPLDWPPPKALQQSTFDVITHMHQRG